MTSTSPVNKYGSVVLAAGLIVLVGVVAPSWARLRLYGDTAVSSPATVYPESPPERPFEAYSDVIARPLFNNDRQKDPAAKPTAAQQLSLDSYRLAGIMTAGAVRVALVERRTTRTMSSLKIGDSLDGRIVKDITPEGIEFAGAEGETLEFPKAQGVRIIQPILKSSALGARRERGPR